MTDKPKATELNDDELEKAQGGKGESFTATDDLTNIKMSDPDTKGSAVRKPGPEGYTEVEWTYLKDRK